MRSLSGRLRKVVAYKNRTTGDFFRVEVRTHRSTEVKLLHAISKLRYVQFHVVTKVLRIS